MFQINEKSIADNRTLITINDEKTNINAVSKNGTINYSMKDNTLWLTTPKIREAYINQNPNIYNLYDKIVIARNGIDIDGSYSFDDDISFKKNIEIKENLLVRGNITVEGDSATINTSTLTVEDNIIELNRNEVGNGITLNVAGAAINRGTKPFARYLYNERDKAFVLDTTTLIDSDIDNSWVLKAYTENNGNFVAGQVDIANKITAPLAKFTDLVADSNATLNALTVNGTSLLKGSSEFMSDASVNGLLTAKTDALVKQKLTVNGTSLLKGAVTMNGTLTVDDVSTYKQLATFNMGALIKTVGLTVEAGGARVTGDSVITGALNVTENATLNKDLNVTQTVNSKNVVATTKLTALDAQVTRNLQVDGNENITGTLTVGNNVILNGTNATINSATTITKDATVDSSDLTITCKSDGTKGNLSVKGNADITKNLTVLGTTNLTGNIIGNADITANNITARYNFSVESGNGQGIKFWNSNNTKIYMSATADAIFGSDVTGAATSDYNMYFKMAGGTNRGFVFRNDLKSLVQIENDGSLRAINHIYAKDSQVLRHADMGHLPANNTPINACMVDGKHYSDLVSQFVDVAGDTMTGKLTMNESIDMTASKPITFNSKVNSFIRGGGTLNNDVILSSAGQTFFYPGGTASKQMILKEDGNLSVLGSNVLRQADEGHGNGIDADTLDGLHKTDYVLTNGSQPMTGDLQMGLNRIKFSNDDYLSFDDGDLTINSQTYTGKYLFSADNLLSNSIIEGGAIKAGNIALSGKDDSIVGVKHLYGANGLIFRSNDAWLRINEASPYTSGVFFGSSVIRTDNALQIGSAGETLLANASSFKYKGSDVITTAGATMNGNLAFVKSKITFNGGADNTGTSGIALSDIASLYGEHDDGAENSRFVIEIKDNPTDAIVFRTATSGSIINDALVINDIKATFKNNPYFGNNRLLHTGDIGAGAGFNADMVDGKHYSDIDATFVKKAGDVMTGELTSTLFRAKNALDDVSLEMKNNGVETYARIRVGGTGPGAANGLTIEGPNDAKMAKFNNDGTLNIRAGRVITDAELGTGKGLDADKLDGKHYSDLVSQFVDVAGDTMTGDLFINKLNPQLVIASTGGKGRLTVSNENVYLQAGKTDDNNLGNLNLTGYNNNPLNVLAIKISNRANAMINDSKILVEADEGHGNGIDADTIDGQHLTDLDTRYLRTIGGTINGNVALNGNMSLGNGQKVNLGSTFIRSGGAASDSLVQVATTGMYFRPAGDSTGIEMYLDPTGILRVKGSQVLTQADEGHNNGIDADTVDGYHLNQNLTTTSSPIFAGLNATGAITATSFSGPLSGNASTATKLATARLISLTGAVSGSASFDGAGNSTIVTTQKGVSITDTFATSFRTQTKGDALNGDYLSVLRNNLASVPNSPQFGSGIAFGRADTHGYLYVNYNTAEAYIGGGSADKLNWTRQLAFTDSPITGNSATASTLETARLINGTAFNGSADITTANWGTARTLTIGSTGKSVNGSANMSWSLAEIGAAAASHTHDYQQQKLTNGAVGISAATDWNNYSDTGFYMGSGLLNQISIGHAWKYMMSIKHNDLYNMQLMTDFNGANMGFRAKTNGVWNAWNTLWHSGNFDPASKANASHTHAKSQITDMPTKLSQFENDLQGAKISTSPTPPSSPSAGELWFKSL